MVLDPLLPILESLTDTTAAMPDLVEVSTTRKRRPPAAPSRCPICVYPVLLFSVIFLRCRRFRFGVRTKGLIGNTGKVMAEEVTSLLHFCASITLSYLFVCVLCRSSLCVYSVLVFYYIIATPAPVYNKTLNGNKVRT